MASVTVVQGSPPRFYDDEGNSGTDHHSSERLGALSPPLSHICQTRELVPPPASCTVVI